ncbi:four helix bundle protein [Hymenobacter sublimis]|uniref:Four helix bundle protein n=1 Tax=Hymenobacter sublimis TaxID=2933777 RepID=A0ABY4JD60_9BACT|nr:four helix bundle protein [Hymenobacter sublimis]UPL50728.1 four helix bundle protein [Hymenobacter sublimis]
MFDFRKLRIWQEGQDLTLRIYQLTRSFPKEELFGLTSQLRRSSASVPHNIAEGCGRQSAPDLLRFLTIAMGSASELESQLLLAQGLEYISTETASQILPDVERLRRMLTAYYQKIKANLPDKHD